MATTKKKIIEYLKSKEGNHNSVLDILFEQYLKGDIENLLKKYGFSKIESFPRIRKGANSLQLNFQYFNLIISIEFRDFNFEFCIYPRGASVEEMENCFQMSEYQDNFCFENFINNLLTEIKQDKRICLTSEVPHKAYKALKYLKFFSLLIPILLCIILCIIALVKDQTLYVGQWVSLIIGVFIVLYCILYCLEKHQK